MDSEARERKVICGKNAKWTENWVSQASLELSFFARCDGEAEMAYVRRNVGRNLCGRAQAQRGWLLDIVVLWWKNSKFKCQKLSASPHNLPQHFMSLSLVFHRTLRQPSSTFPSHDCLVIPPLKCWYLFVVTREGKIMLTKAFVYSASRMKLSISASQHVATSKSCSFSQLKAIMISDDSRAEAGGVILNAYARFRDYRIKSRRS